MYSRLVGVPGERQQGRRRNEPRGLVVGRLLDEDAAYREYYKRTFVEVMNYRLTPAFLRERSDFYETAAVRFGIRDRQYVATIRSFLERRPAVLRAVTEKFLATGPSRKLVVTGPRIRLDGFEVGTGFSGWYFPGMTVVADVPDGSGRIRHWLVNGARRNAGPRLELKMDEDIQLEAVLN
jgi:hypothetical protein